MALDYGRDGLELVDLVLGNLLGEGQYRKVFPFRANDRYVMKAADTWQGINCNFAEWDLWCQLKDKPLGAWLAPIESISSGGRYLVMWRASRMTHLPRRVPLMLAGDLKPANWGMINGRPRCVDYGNWLQAHLLKADATKLVRAKWGDH